MVEKRGIIAHFTVKDDYNSNKGTLDQFLDEIGQGGNRKDDSKVVCVDAVVIDGRRVHLRPCPSVHRDHRNAQRRGDLRDLHTVFVR